jgi:hypothetical protein
MILRKDRDAASENLQDLKKGNPGDAMKAGSASRMR